MAFKSPFGISLCCLFITVGSHLLFVHVISIAYYITLDEITIHSLFYELFFVAIGMKQQTHLINLVKEGLKIKLVNKIKGRTKLWEMNSIFAEK